MIPHPSRLIQALCVATLIAGTARAEELTLETGEKSGEVYFLWQATLNEVAARSHRLSGMPSFERVYSKGLLEKLLISEIREMDTDKPLEFNYVLPPRYGLSAELRDVAWYYPHPIPAGGRVRVQIRGKMIAPKIYSGDSTHFRISYETRASCFVVIPLGFAVTYCSSPIVIHEKNSHTVCAFTGPEVALMARHLSVVGGGSAAPVIRRESYATPIRSKLPFRVEPCEDRRVLDAALRSLNGSVPVVFAGFDESSPETRWAAPGSWRPGETLIWRINGIVLHGPQEFEAVSSQLAIGETAIIHHVERTTQGAIAPKGPVKVTVVVGEAVSE